MAAAFSSTHFTALNFLILLFLRIVASSSSSSPNNSSFSFAGFDKDLKFYGGSRVVNGGSAVQVSGSESLQGGVMYKKPIKLFEGKPKQSVSFSTDFTFSISSLDGGGLAFVMVPRGFEDDVFDESSSGVSSKSNNRRSKVVVDVEFTTSKFGRNGDYSVSVSNVVINVGDLATAKASNTSIIKMALRNGRKLHTWIDYAASSQRLEVRLSLFGHSRPSDPLVWYSIDFSHMWKQSQMFVGFNQVKGNNSSNSQSSQPCFLYSWSFMPRYFPHWMHSEPLDLKTLDKNSKPLTDKPRSDCVLRVLAAMIFGGGCGALTAFIVLYMWTIFGSRRPVAPEECVVAEEKKPVDFEYKKVNVVVDKAIKDGKE